jgi:hypothetical protein
VCVRAMSVCVVPCHSKKRNSLSAKDVQKLLITFGKFGELVERLCLKIYFHSMEYSVQPHFPYHMTHDHHRLKAFPIRLVRWKCLEKILEFLYFKVH